MKAMAFVRRFQQPISFSGPTGVSPFDKEIKNGPLSGKDPILEMVSIFEYVLEKSNCRYNNGEVYQFEVASKSTYVPG